MIHLYGPLFFSFVFLIEVMRTNSIYYAGAVIACILIDSIFCAKLRSNAPPGRAKLDKVKAEILEEIAKTNGLADLKDEVMKLKGILRLLSGRDLDER